MNVLIASAGLKTLLDTGFRRRLPKGQVLSGLGENFGLAMVESGYIKRYLITREGNHSIQSVYGPGDIFPLTPVFQTFFNLDIGEKEEIFYYEAMTTAQMRSIAMGDLQMAVQDDPELYRDLLHVAGIRLRSNIQRLSNMSLSSSYQKLAHQLVYFAEEFGKHQGVTVEIMVPLTTQDLANILNVARETASRNLSRLQRKGLIKQGQCLIVTDLDKLRREVR